MVGEERIYTEHLRRSHTLSALIYPTLYPHQYH